VGVTNGDKLLITRYAKNRNYSYDALVAGFTEIGETFEETVAREVGEEVGLKIKNIRYYKSQPWGYSGSILAGFFCDVDGSDQVCLDESELSSAVWTERSQITGQPDGFSLTNDMMMAFKNGKE
jgi:NAD+ diphosphatase